MRQLLKNLLICLSIVAGPSFSNATALTAEQSAVLSDFLLSEIAQRFGAVEMVHQATADGELRDSINSALTSDPRYKEALLSGAQFREQFFATWKGSVETAKVRFFVDPEAAALEWLREVMGEKSKAQTLPITEIRARLRAWQDTVARFSLGSDLTLAKVEELKYSQAFYQSVSIFYHRRYMRLMEAEELSVTFTDQEVIEIKRKLIAHLNAVRSAHYRWLVQAAEANQVSVKAGVQKLGTPKDETVTLGTKVSFSLKPGSLTHSFLNFDDEVRGYLNITKLADSRGTSPLNFLTLNSRKGEWRVANGYYAPVLRRPTTPLMTVALQNGDGTLTVSEENFSGLIEVLSLRMAKDLNSSQAALKQAVIDSSARDAAISDLASFVHLDDDHDIDHLMERISKRMYQRQAMNAQRALSFVDATRQLLQFRQTSDALNNLIWSGLRQNASHWHVRDIAAHELGKPDFFSGEIARVKATRSERQESALVRERNRTPQERIRGAWLRYTAAALIIGSVIAPWEDIDPIGHIESAYGANVGLWLSDGDDGDTSVTSRAKEKKQVRGKQPKFNRKRVSIDNHDSPSNIAQPDSGADNPVYHIYGYDPKKVSVPRYFNYPSIERHYLESSPYSLPKEAKSQLRVESMVPQGDDGLIPIVVPSGYEITDIKMWNENGIDRVYEYSVDYTLHYYPQVGTYYAELSEEAQKNDPDVQYDVGYRKTQVDSLPSEVTVLDKTTLRKLNDYLRKNEATQLAQALDALTYTKTKVTLKDVGAVFAETGVYTYDRENVPEYNGTPFSEFNHFLRDGVYYYQCTGSNTLLRVYLDYYYRDEFNAEFLKRYRPLNISSFAYSGDDFLRSKNGHRYTMVAGVGRLDKKYIELDGTPKTMDPKYLGLPTPPEFPPEPRVAISISGQLRPAEERKDTDEVTSNGAASQIKPLEDAHARARDAVKKYSQTFPALAGKDARVLPGTNLLPYSRVFQQFLRQERTGIETIYDLLLLRANVSPENLSADQVKAFLGQAQVHLNNHADENAAIYSLIGEPVGRFNKQAELFRSKPFDPKSPVAYLRNSELMEAFSGLANLLAPPPENPLSECELELLGEDFLRPTSTPAQTQGHE